MSGPLQTALDLVALGAFVAFSILCFTLTRSMKGSALKRGFLIAGVAGLVHLVGNVTAVIGDFGLGDYALTDFPIIQALFAVLLAIAVRSFFPAWFKSFKKDSGKLPGFGSS